MKLTKIRLKTASVQDSTGVSSGVLDASKGWEIETGASSVTATNGARGIWIPHTEVLYGEYEPAKPTPAAKGK